MNIANADENQQTAVNAPIMKLSDAVPPASNSNVEDIRLSIRCQKTKIATHAIEITAYKTAKRFDQLTQRRTELM